MGKLFGEISQGAPAHDTVLLKTRPHAVHQGPGASCRRGLDSWTADFQEFISTSQLNSQTQESVKAGEADAGSQFSAPRRARSEGRAADADRRAGVSPEHRASVFAPRKGRRVSPNSVGRAHVKSARGTAS